MANLGRPLRGNQERMSDIYSKLVAAGGHFSRSISIPQWVSPADQCSRFGEQAQEFVIFEEQIDG
jgi:hypothetical protein